MSLGKTGIPYLLAIDPGSQQSACVTLDTKTRAVVDKEIMHNLDLADSLVSARASGQCDHLAIEMVASYGMAVGASVFDTCVWIGRFIEAWGGTEFTLVYRLDVKLAMCGSARANDSNIRQAILDMHGGKEKAVGTKKSPGPLYGIKKDMWSALAIGLTWIIQQEEQGNGKADHS